MARITEIQDRLTMLSDALTQATDELRDQRHYNRQLEKVLQIAEITVQLWEESHVQGTSTSGSKALEMLKKAVRNAKNYPSG